MILNVTATDAETEGYITVYPCGEPPLTSNVNFVPGRNTPNAVIAPWRLEAACASTARRHRPRGRRVGMVRGRAARLADAASGRPGAAARSHPRRDLVDHP